MRSVVFMDVGMLGRGSDERGVSEEFRIFLGHMGDNGIAIKFDGMCHLMILVTLSKKNGNEVNYVGNNTGNMYVCIRVILLQLTESLITNTGSC